MQPDRDLLTEFATDRSEAAFRALVTRHVDLVFATARRQVGDAGMAEEVAQNVFAALARKAPRLKGVESIAGWLHRTAMLESKARIRSELRRRRREERAVEWAALRNEGSSPWAALTPLLDEGLLQLREKDRQALITRFLEGHSFREVGLLLGVDEDAARKRVTRALNRLSDFFRARGFAVPSGAGAVALFSEAATAAPAGLAASAAGAGLAAGPAVGGLNLILLQIMALTKTQTAALCVFIAGAPLIWQWHHEARLMEEQQQLSNRIAAGRSQSAEIEENLRRTRAAIARAEAERLEFRQVHAVPAVQTEPDSPHPDYEWKDDSALIRVPKGVVAQMDVSAFANKRGELTGAIKEVLQMNDAEALLTQFAVERFLGDFHAAQAQTMRAVEPSAEALGGRNREEVRAFDLGSIGDTFEQLRGRLFQELESALGPDRLELFRKGMQSWMPDEFGGLSTAIAVLNVDHRLHFYRPAPGDDRIGWRVGQPDAGFVQASIPLDEIPWIYHAYLADWIALARSDELVTAGDDHP